MVNKRGQGHVEIILSMVLFVGFLIFLFVFMRSPFKTKQTLDITSIQQKVLEEINSDIGKLSVIIDPPGIDGIENCYSLDEVNTKTFGDNFIEIQEDPTNPRSYTIYYGDFFVGGKTISCSGPENFELGVYTEESIVVKEKINNEAYDSLKSAGLDSFSFQVRGSFKSKEQIPANVDVFSKDIPIRVMDNKANIQEQILNIKIWG